MLKLLKTLYLKSTLMPKEKYTTMAVLDWDILIKRISSVIIKARNFILLMEMVR